MASSVKFLRGLVIFAVALIEWAALPMKSANSQIISGIQDKARLEAETLLNAARARNVFQVETNHHGMTLLAPMVKHKPSGFDCTFETSQPINQIVVYDDKPDSAHVACITGHEIIFSPVGHPELRLDKGILKREFTFWRTDMSAEQVLTLRTAELRKADPPVQTLPTQKFAKWSSLADVNTPWPEEARFVTHSAFEGIAVGRIGEWLVELTVTGPSDLPNFDAADTNLALAWQLEASGWPLHVPKTPN
jgi:hypothetical protein